jgi:hypothetical protein
MNDGTNSMSFAQRPTKKGEEADHHYRTLEIYQSGQPLRFDEHTTETAEPPESIPNQAAAGHGDIL